MSMESKKTIFAVSDIHGYYTAFKRALDESGFDAENENHIFMCLGDLFDRGEENVAVYDYIKALPRKILLRGNHDEVLRDALVSGALSQVVTDNNTDLTIKDFLGKDAIDENGRIDVETHAEKVRELIAFVDSMGDYYEVGDLIFTHGWLPIDVDKKRRTACLLQNWRDASAEEWSDAHWVSWNEVYSVGAVLDGKTIVCGHRTARMGDRFDPMREPDCTEPFFGKGVIAIDAGTNRSGRVNVLRLEISD